MTSKAIELLVASAELTGICSKLLRQDVDLLRKHGATEAEIATFIETQMDRYDEVKADALAEIGDWLAAKAG